MLSSEEDNDWRVGHHAHVHVTEERESGCAMEKMVGCADVCWLGERYVWISNRRLWKMVS